MEKFKRFFKKFPKRYFVLAIIVAVTVSLATVSGTFATFQTTVIGTGETPVAHWDFKVKINGDYSKDDGVSDSLVTDVKLAGGDDYSWTQDVPDDLSGIDPDTAYSALSDTLKASYTSAEYDGYRVQNHKYNRDNNDQLPDYYIGPGTAGYIPVEIDGSASKISILVTVKAYFADLPEDIEFYDNIGNKLTVERNVSFTPTGKKSTDAFEETEIISEGRAKTVADVGSYSAITYQYYLGHEEVKTWNAMTGDTFIDIGFRWAWVDNGKDNQNYDYTHVYNEVRVTGQQVTNANQIEGIRAIHFVTENSVKSGTTNKSGFIVDNANVLNILGATVDESNVSLNVTKDFYLDVNGRATAGKTYTFTAETDAEKIVLGTNRRDHLGGNDYQSVANRPYVVMSDASCTNINAYISGDFTYSLATMKAANVNAKTLVENMNAIIDAEGSSDTLYDTFSKIIENKTGTDLATNYAAATSVVSLSNLVRSVYIDGTSILWSVKTKRFVYLKDGEEVLLYNVKTIDEDDKVNLFKVYGSFPTDDQEYSIYLAGTDADGAIEGLEMGFDAGANTGISSITYVGTGVAQSVIVRTAAFGTTLTVNAPLDTVTHYGYAGLVEVKKVAQASYDEYGTVGRLFATGTDAVGHIAVMAGATVYQIEQLGGSATSVSVAADATVYDVDGNAIDGAVTEDTSLFTATAGETITAAECSHISTTEVVDGIHVYEVCKTCGYTVVGVGNSGAKMTVADSKSGNVIMPKATYDASQVASNTGNTVQINKENGVYVTPSIEATPDIKQDEETTCTHNWVASDNGKGTRTYTCSKCYAYYTETYEVVTDSSKYTKVGDYIYFGSYPQSKVTDNSLIETLNTKAGALPTASDNNKWSIYKYYISDTKRDFMWYTNVQYNGEKYRGVYFTKYRPSITSDSDSAENSYQDENGYYTGTVYWFKYEQIKWKKLYADGRYVTMVAEMVLDAQEYSRNTTDANGVHGNNYLESDIRDWLGFTFYTSAFNSTQMGLLEVVSSSNDASSMVADVDSAQYKGVASDYACASTIDKIWLLSTQEATTASYGYSTDIGGNATRIKNATDYAQCQGVNTASNTDKGLWWLRSPANGVAVNGYTLGSVSGMVGSTGSIGYQGVNYTAAGVVPVVRIYLDAKDAYASEQEETEDPTEQEEEETEDPTEQEEEETTTEESDGSYITFGSYPQSKVITTSVKTALNKLAGSKPDSISSGNWTAYNYTFYGVNQTPITRMWYQDVEYQNQKYRGVYIYLYRGIYTYESGSTDNSHYQESSGYTSGDIYWFKYEPIKWKVLGNNNGNLTLMADLILDSQDYNHTSDNAYATSTIRTWLNDNFYNTAFDSQQKALIQAVTVDNSARSANPNNNATYYNQGANEYASANTSDKVRLLSLQEATNSTYGFGTSSTANDTAKQKQATAYACSQGLATGTSGKYSWWLRSPVYSGKQLAYNVNTSGNLDAADGVVYKTSFGVVPVITMQTQSDSVYVKEGDNYLYFGSYPQTEVTDTTLKATLTEQAGDLPVEKDSKAWTSYHYYAQWGNYAVTIVNTTDYMWYQDIAYNGEKYRGVYFNYYRPFWSINPCKEQFSYQATNGYTKDNVYWFKYEPVKWRILESENGYATILAELILDSQEVYYYSEYKSTTGSTTVYANNYKNSGIRTWLNDTFYNTAFNSLQKQLIQTVTVDNSAALDRITKTKKNVSYNSITTNSEYICENTDDKVWLLSVREVSKTSYGFSSSIDETTADTARLKKPTAYAKCQGLDLYRDGTYAGYGQWWLRSPSTGYENGYKMACVSKTVYGNPGLSYEGTSGSDVGIVPALKVRIW